MYEHLYEHTILLVRKHGAQPVSFLSRVLETDSLEGAIAILEKSRVDMTIVNGPLGGDGAVTGLFIRRAREINPEMVCVVLNHSE